MNTIAKIEASAGWRKRGSRAGGRQKAALARLHSGGIAKSRCTPALPRAGGRRLPLWGYAPSLKWGYPRDNMDDQRRHGTLATGERNGKAKLTDSEVVEVRCLYRSKAFSQYQLARIYKVSQSSISNLVRGKTRNIHPPMEVIYD